MRRGEEEENPAAGGVHPGPEDRPELGRARAGTNLQELSIKVATTDADMDAAAAAAARPPLLQLPSRLKLLTLNFGHTVGGEERRSATHWHQQDRAMVH
jgi:hypothetical protein